jgi:hypothetical protein
MRGMMRFQDAVPLEEWQGGQVVAIDGERSNAM